MSSCLYHGYFFAHYLYYLSPIGIIHDILSEALRWACDICIALGDSKPDEELFATANVDDEVLDILYRLRSKNINTLITPNNQRHLKPTTAGHHTCTIRIIVTSLYKAREIIRVNRRKALFLTLLHHPHACFILPRTLPFITILAKPLPQPPFSTFSPRLYLSILLLLFRAPKLSTHLRLVHRSQSVLQHLI